MFRKVLQSAVFSALVLGATSALAQFDGNKSVICAIGSAHSCSPFIGCEAVPPDSVGLPAFVSLDFQQQLIVPAGSPGDKRLSAIAATKIVDGKLILQGIEDGEEAIVDGAGWSASIEQATGRLSVTLTSAPDSLVVFGSCLEE